MTYKELQEAFHYYEGEEANRKKKDMAFYMCPNCGYAVRSISTNGVKCKGCGKTVIIEHGQVKGWR